MPAIRRIAKTIRLWKKSAVSDGGKYDIAKRFIDMVREDGPDDAGTVHLRSLRSRADQECADNAGDEVEGKKTC